MEIRSPKAKILIADDSEILNNMLKDVFDAHGFDVVQAFDGDECKMAFLEEDPDIALVDIHMPKIKGIELLSYFKEKSPRTIVVIMTGIGSEETALTAMKLGADEYLKKPFDMGDVLSLSEKLLENRRIAEDNVRLRKQVRRREKYLAHLTTIIREALVTADPLGNIRFVNRAASEMWGYSRSELKGKDIRLLIQPEKITPLRSDLVEDTIKLGRIEGEFQFERKDKTVFPGYLSTSIMVENGQLTGILAVVADLTRVYDIEKRLKQSEKLASLGKVVEGVAHEVRNCLTSLGGFSRRLQKLNAEDLTAAHYSGIILDNVARLERMVHDIEDYVRFSKSYSFQFNSVDLVEIIQKAHKRVIDRLSTSHVGSVSIKWKAENHLPRILADAVALVEVFYNLILNAYEAMPDGGNLSISLKNSGGVVSVALVDTGVGIKEQDLSEVFNPFFTSKTSGAGMGLSKAHLLVQEHNGVVDISSEPEKGTTVEVVLPVDRTNFGFYPWESAFGKGEDTSKFISNHSEA
jgi:PAS domain S-box-containing protein